MSSELSLSTKLPLHTPKTSSNTQTTSPLSLAFFFFLVSLQITQLYSQASMQAAVPSPALPSYLFKPSLPTSLLQYTALSLLPAPTTSCSADYTQIMSQIKQINLSSSCSNALPSTESSLAPWLGALPVPLFMCTCPISTSLRNTPAVALLPPTAL